MLLAADFFLPLRLLGSYFHIAMNGAASAEKIFKLLTAEEPADGDRVPGENTTLKLEHVTFGYEKDRTILNDVSFTIPQGSFVSLVGESGCGKSTIAALLSGSRTGYTGSVTLGGVLNIVLDPFFILPQYMNMGAAGAGLATAISNTAGTLFFLLCLLRRSSTVLSLRPCHLKHTGVYIREILSIGFPSALQYALTVVSLAVLSLFVSKYAVEAVAAYGIVKKLDNLPLYFSLGTSAGLLPFLSYNYASGDRERQRQGFVFGVSITVGFSLACVIVFELFAPQLARLFIQDDVTVAYAAAFLRRMVLCMPFVAICHPMITQFQAMGRTRESLICSILRKGSLDIPLLLLLDRLYPLYGCALVQPVVDLISLIVALVLYRRLRRTSVV